MKNIQCGFVAIAVATFVFTSSCKTNKEDKCEIGTQDFAESIVDFAVQRRQNKLIELPEIYATLYKQIPNDSEESLVLVRILKRKGFKVVDWGRGNYSPRGPRIIKLVLQNGDCTCDLEKIYYKTIADTLFEATERIKCYNQ